MRSWLIPIIVLAGIFVLLYHLAHGQVPKTPNLGLSGVSDTAANQNFSIIDGAFGTDFQVAHGLTPLPPNVDPTGVLDSTSGIQAALDTGQNVTLTKGIFSVCVTNSNPVILRGANQHIRGQGAQTVISCGTACTAGCFLGGPPPPLGVGQVAFGSNQFIEDMIFIGGGPGLSFINIEGDDNQGLTVKRVSCDVGQPGLALSGGANCVVAQGASHLEFEHINCFASHTGRGQCFNISRGGTDISILDSVIRNTSKGIILVANPDLSATTQTEETLDGLEIARNYADGGWYTAPVNQTCSGGACTTTNTTYGASTAVVSGITLAGLCSGDLSAACTATTTCSAGCPGNVIRVMVPKVTTSDAASSFFSGGRIKTPSVDFVTAGAQHGDLIRTSVSLCNGSAGSTVAQNVCPGAAGLGGWSDGCTCTSAADCSSAICEPRFAIVNEVVTIQVAGGPACTSTNKCEVMLDEGWLSDSTRLPTSAPPTGTPYVLYDPLIGQVHDFNATTINLCIGNCVGSMNGWRDLLGNNTTPTNGGVLEILTSRPGYTFLNADASVRNVRDYANVSKRSFSDGHSTFGYRWSIFDNRSQDGNDVCFTIDGSHNEVAGNYASHCGSQGFFLRCNDCDVHDNYAVDNVWTNPNAGTVPQGDFTVNGSNRLNFHHNHPERLLNLPNAKYGITASGAGAAMDGAIFDSNTPRGSYVTSSYRLDNAGLTNLAIKQWDGSSITVNSTPTWSIQGGSSTFAQFPPTTGLLAASYWGCKDCTVAAPCSGAGTGALAVSTSAPAVNCK